jgi:PAS domain S-box-containing protein
MMRSNPSKANLQKPGDLFNSHLNRLTLLPVPFLTAAILVLWFADLRTPHEYPLLLTILNFIFLTLTALFVMFLAWRSYLKTEEYGLLMLGCGALLWAIGGSASFLVLGKGINATVTVHNSLACLAALCHFSGVTLSRRWKKTKMPGLILAILTAVSLVAAGIIIIMTVYGWMPVFFVQGQGGTHIRQAVLVLAILLFGHTAVSLWSADRRNPSVFVRWYGAALLLLTTGLLGVLLQPAFGGLLGWAGRTAQYLGGIYMLIAAITSMRETGISGLSLDEVLSESESRFQALSEATVEGIAITEHGLIIDVNEQLAGMYGYTRAELIGNEVSKLVHPDEVERVMENIFHDVESVIEHRGLRRDGQILTLEAHARNIVYMGRPARLTTIHDITERKKIEEAFLKSKENYKELVTNANSIIIRMEKSGTITFFNEYAQKFFGYTLDEILGKDVKILLPQTESNGKNLSEMLDNILRNPDGFEENINENIRKNGERIWVLWKNKAIRDSNGNIIGNLAVGSDITERVRAEQALKESEAVLYSFFDSPGAMRGIIEVIAEDDVRHIKDNSVTADFIGLTPGSMNNKTGSELGEPGDILRIWVKHYMESQQSGKPVTFEYADKRKDAWLRATVSYLGTPHGYPRFGYVVQDITQHKHAEEALRKSEQRFRSIAENMSEGLMIFGPQGNLIYQNPAAMRIHGFSDQEEATFALDNLTDMWQGWDDQHRLLPFDKWPIYRVFRGESFQNQVLHVLRPDTGLEFDASYNGCPIYDNTGKLALAFITIRDITEHRKTEMALYESERRFRVAQELSPDGFTILHPVRDEQGNIIDFTWVYENAAIARLIGTDPAAVLGRRILDVNPSHAESPFFRAYTQVAMSGKSMVLEAPFHGETMTEEKWFRVAVVPSDQDIAILAQDITERKHAEYELRRAYFEMEVRVEERTADLKKMNNALNQTNKALEDFSHVASHDLQEPLRKIITFSERLAHADLSRLNDQEHDYLSRMQKSAARMQTLIQDLAKYSRATSSPDYFKMINLKKPVEEAVADLAVLLEETGGRVEIDELPDVNANETQMRHLFQNLIGNSLKYRSSQQPLVKIYIIPSSQDGFHEVHIEDNGIGFDEMYLDKIFKPFQRLHGKSSPYDGTGMGLAICKKIVEFHDGSITARSKPGNGSTFIVKLPKT